MERRYRGQWLPMLAEYSWQLIRDVPDIFHKRKLFFQNESKIKHFFYNSLYFCMTNKKICDLVVPKIIGIPYTLFLIILESIKLYRVRNYHNTDIRSVS